MALDGISPVFIVEAEQKRERDRDSRVLRAWAAGIAACAVIALSIPTAINVIKTVRGQFQPGGQVKLPEQYRLVAYDSDYEMYPETEYEDKNAPKTASVTVGGVTYEGEYVTSIMREGRQYADVVHMYRDADGVKFGVDIDGALVSFDCGGIDCPGDLEKEFDESEQKAKVIEIAVEQFSSGSIVYEAGDESMNQLFSGVPSCAYDFQKTVGGVKCAPYMSITMHMNNTAYIDLTADRTDYSCVDGETAQTLAYSDEAEAAVVAMLAEKYASVYPAASFNYDLDYAKRTLYIVDGKAVVEYSMIRVNGGVEDDSEIIDYTTAYVTYDIGQTEPHPDDYLPVYENGEHGVTLEQTGVTKRITFASEDAMRIYYEDTVDGGSLLGISITNDTDSAISVIHSEVWRRENGKWVRRYGYEFFTDPDPIEAGGTFTYDISSGFGVAGDEFVIYLEFEKNGEQFYVRYEFTAEYPCRHQIMREIDGVPVDNYLGVDLMQIFYSSPIYEGTNTIFFQIFNFTDRAVTWSSGRTDKYTDGKWETFLMNTDLPPEHTLDADSMEDGPKLEIPLDIEAGTYRHYVLVTDADGKQFYISYDFTVYERKDDDAGAADDKGDDGEDYMNAFELWATGTVYVDMTREEIERYIPEYWQSEEYPTADGSLVIYSGINKSGIAVVYDKGGVSVKMAPLCTDAGVDEQFIVGCLGEPDRTKELPDGKGVCFVYSLGAVPSSGDRMTELLIDFDNDGQFVTWLIADYLVEDVVDTFDGVPVDNGRGVTFLYDEERGDLILKNDSGKEISFNPYDYRLWSIDNAGKMNPAYLGDFIPEPACTLKPGETWEQQYERYGVDPSELAPGRYRAAKEIYGGVNGNFYVTCMFTVEKK